MEEGILAYQFLDSFCEKIGKDIAFMLFNKFNCFKVGDYTKFECDFEPN